MADTFEKDEFQIKSTEPGLQTCTFSFYLRPMSKILIIDDEKVIRATLREILEYEKFEVSEASDGEEGLKKIQSEDFDLVLCDVKMPKMDGIEVLSHAKDLDKAPQFIMISAHGSIETAVEATKKGAFDFIPKPPDLNRLLLTVRNALDKKNLVTETKVLKKKLSKKFDMVGESPAIVQVKETIEKVAPTEARVLITGPNGTGKELVAHWLHQKSSRAKEPFVAVNCAAIPSELIESELFGHEKGAFTSAHKQRAGKFEQAQGGTLFLDEIGDMSLSAQSKVLRALQENLINRVGSDKDIKVDVRVLAATNKDLKKEIEEGNFREDLYHRLSVIVVQVPALKDRVDDIPLLVDKFLNDIAQESGDAKRKISKEALEKLKTYPWTGNIRELRNVVERLVILGEDTISLEDIKKYADY
ncbi:MAG: two component signal transduction system Sigma54-dependent response regulator [Algoriphagus marincola HL-49]|uniref:Two component signal transduction system Sigma54-dependent response regulator n=3 Tax=Algoriphagus TaxID=246875 RepID=A0A0P8ALD2_9BACT|nr:MAG: two component signal transduction system Sigma54-dependent response regulator [Algoriphagus marincola HL-49]